MMNNNEIKQVQPIDPSKLIGKEINHVVDRLEHHGFKYRIVNKDGLITSDYDPERYTLVRDFFDEIVDAYYG